MLEARTLAPRSSREQRHPTAQKSITRTGQRVGNPAPPEGALGALGSKEQIINPAVASTEISQGMIVGDGPAANGVSQGSMMSREIRNGRSSMNETNCHLEDAGSYRGWVCTTLRKVRMSHFRAPSSTRALNLRGMFKFLLDLSLHARHSCNRLAADTYRSSLLKSKSLYPFALSLSEGFPPRARLRPFDGLRRGHAQPELKIHTSLGRSNSLTQGIRICELSFTS